MKEEQVEVKVEVENGNKKHSFTTEAQRAQRKDLCRERPHASSDRIWGDGHIRSPVPLRGTGILRDTDISYTTRSVGVYPEQNLHCSGYGKYAPWSNSL